MTASTGREPEKLPEKWPELLTLRQKGMHEWWWECKCGKVSQHFVYPSAALSSGWFHLRREHKLEEEI